MMEAYRMPPLRVAILDLNNNVPNLGLTCIKNMVKLQSGEVRDVLLEYDVFDVRHKNEMPDLSYDIYISSGGPGSPYDGEGLPWEPRYFEWIEAVWQHNLDHHPSERKHIFFICHSFQMMVRHFALAEVVQRKGESFGVFECEMAEGGGNEACFKGLENPFFIADFRSWQVIKPNLARMESLGASLLCIEQERPHVPLERAVMGIRVSPEIVGVQFHPEADPPGMAWHFMQPQRQKAIREAHGEEKFERIMMRLYDPNYLDRTYKTVLPNFLQNAVECLRPEESVFA